MRDYDYSKIKRVEDYTDAFLVCAWVLLLMGLVTLAIHIGFLLTVVIGWVAGRWLNNIRRARMNL